MRMRSLSLFLRIKKISYGGTSKKRQEEQLKIALDSLKEAERLFL